MIVVAIIGLLMAVAIPNVVSQRKKAQRQACISNLRTFNLVKAQWALETKKNDADVPTDADIFGADKYIEKKPDCPAGGTYDLRAVSEKSTCSAPEHVLP
jgi:competence protein ComGC